MKHKRLKGSSSSSSSSHQLGLEKGVFCTLVAEFPVVDVCVMAQC